MRTRRAGHCPPPTNPNRSPHRCLTPPASRLMDEYPGSRLRANEQSRCRQPQRPAIPGRWCRLGGSVWRPCTRPRISLPRVSIRDGQETSVVGDDSGWGLLRRPWRCERTNCPGEPVAGVGSFVRRLVHGWQDRLITPNRHRHPSRYHRGVGCCTSGENHSDIPQGVEAPFSSAALGSRHRYRPPAREGI